MRDDRIFAGWKIGNCLRRYAFARNLSVFASQRELCPRRIGFDFKSTFASHEMKDGRSATLASEDQRGFNRIVARTHDSQVVFAWFQISNVAGLFSRMIAQNHEGAGRIGPDRCLQMQISVRF